MTAHEIIGKIVHNLIKGNAFIDFESIQQEVVDEFMKVSKPGMDQDIAAAYSEALKIVATEYTPKL